MRQQHPDPIRSSREVEEILAIARLLVELSGDDLRALRADIEARLGHRRRGIVIPIRRE